MRQALGAEWESFRLAHTTAAPSSIRLNPMKKFTVELEPVPWTRFGYYLKERPVFTFDPLFHAGAYYVQEASSMFLEQVIRQSVNLQSPLRVLDLSAAPGGKSTHLLSLLTRDSLLVANEVIRSRAGVLSENIQKWGYPNCMVTNNDPADFSALKGFFDVIVVDAPCSGEGLFRKDGRAMHEWSPDHVSICAARQKRILHDIWPALKKDGILVYSTCTYNSSENEDTLIDLSTSYKCEFLDIALDAAWKVTRVEKRPVRGYKLYPHLVKGEGFFIAAAKKQHEEHAVPERRPKRRLTPLDKKLTAAVDRWITDAETFEFFAHGDRIFFLHHNHVADINFLLDRLRFVYAGTNAALAKHDKLVPEHALAMSVLLNDKQFKTIELTEGQALQYLRKETIDLTGAGKGFALVTHRGRALGWVNLLGNRANNMYPSEWRIRMSSSPK